MLSVSLDCPCLIAPSVSFNVYLTPLHFINVPVPSQESERSCICVLRVSLPSLYQARKVSGHVFVC
jgi:hypothetical protein